MNQIDIGTNQFAHIADMLNNKVTVMSNELQIKRGNVLARCAGARGFMPHGYLLIAKCHVGGFKKFEQSIAACKSGFAAIREHRISLQFGDHHEWRKLLNEQFEQFGQYLVRMLQLRLRNVGSIARDISDDKITMLSNCRHIYDTNYRNYTLAFL